MGKVPSTSQEKSPLFKKMTDRLTELIIEQMSLTALETACYPIHEAKRRMDIYNDRVNSLPKHDNN